VELISVFASEFTWGDSAWQLALLRMFTFCEVCIEYSTLNFCAEVQIFVSPPFAFVRASVCGHVLRRVYMSVLRFSFDIKRGYCSDAGTCSSARRTVHGEFKTVIAARHDKLDDIANLNKHRPTYRNSALTVNGDCPI
jgi:hypothetical protein